MWFDGWVMMIDSFCQSFIQLNCDRSLIAHRVGSRKRYGPWHRRRWPIKTDLSLKTSLVGISSACSRYCEGGVVSDVKNVAAVKFLESNGWAKTLYSPSPTFFGPVATSRPVADANAAGCDFWLAESRLESGRVPPPRRKWLGHRRPCAKTPSKSALGTPGESVPSPEKQRRSTLGTIRHRHASATRTQPGPQRTRLLIPADRLVRVVVGRRSCRPELDPAEPFAAGDGLVDFFQISSRMGRPTREIR